MSITRINRFTAREGEGERLREHLRSFIPAIRQLPGCLSCELLEGEENPTRLAVIEVWENVAAHRASAAAIPPGTIERAMELLAERPSGEYYRRVEVQ